MPLPAPHLDDRRFQDLVDDAKRHVQRACPEWTDHNVSDPGVTLIEACAYMVDQLLYRLNRVPERHYVKFLELIGVRPFPPTAATVDVTFRLSAPRDVPVAVRAGTQVAAVREENAEPLTFATVRELSMVPVRLARLATVPHDGQPREHPESARGEGWAACFPEQPAPGDAVLFGLVEPAPSCMVRLRMECEVAGRGVDPADPPVAWEAWTDAGWVRCDVDSDSTGALNRTGDIVLHLPAGHAASTIGRQRAGWLRCRLVAPAAGQRFFHASPRLRAPSAVTIGGTVPAVHAETVVEEIIGISEGVPGQRFAVRYPPLVAGGPAVAVQVAGVAGWETWEEVSSFAGSGADDRHVVVDRGAGEIIFGPVVRRADGTLRRHGAVPARAAPIRLPTYRTGGGRRGNVARGTLTVLRDPVPFVSTVTNRRPAVGGVDGESVADATVRGPLTLRTRDRAVTAEDYELLAREAAPEAVRVRCVPPREAGEAVLVLLVPAVGEAGGDATRFADLQPGADLLERVRGYLDERRCLGAQVRVEPAYYQGVTVVAALRAQPRTAHRDLHDRAVAALFGYLDPVRGGPDGTGWPFGRPVHAGEVYAVLQRLAGVELVDEVRLFAADPRTGERGDEVPRIELGRNALVYSYAHQVRIR